MQNTQRHKNFKMQYFFRKICCNAKFLNQGIDSFLYAKLHLNVNLFETDGCGTCIVVYFVLNTLLQILFVVYYSHYSRKYSMSC